MTTPAYPIHSLCVYCGSAMGNNPGYVEAATQLAISLVKHNIRLVYGGGNVGLMGAISTEVMRHGGHVTGIIPQQLLDMEVGHRDITELHVVKDMHERKAKMAELSDGFIAMPGGIGTLEELFEVMTWAQLGFHEKPIGLYNALGFYDKLQDFLSHQVQEGFLKQQHQDLLITDANPDTLIDKMSHYDAKHVKKSWQPFR